MIIKFYVHERETYIVMQTIEMMGAIPQQEEHHALGENGLAGHADHAGHLEVRMEFLQTLALLQYSPFEVVVILTQLVMSGENAIAGQITFIFHLIDEHNTTRSFSSVCKDFAQHFNVWINFGLNVRAHVEFHRIHLADIVHL